MGRLRRRLSRRKSPAEPQEIAGRKAYYEAALVGIILVCDKCQAVLDPDVDLGPDQSFESDGYYILLGDEAFQRGWRIESIGGPFEVSILCPACAKRVKPVVKP